MLPRRSSLKEKKARAILLKWVVANKEDWWKLHVRSRIALNHQDRAKCSSVVETWRCYVAHLEKSMYGARDGSKLWQKDHTALLESCGCAAGRSNPVVHGCEAGTRRRLRVFLVRCCCRQGSANTESMGDAVWQALQQDLGPNRGFLGCVRKESICASWHALADGRLVHSRGPCPGAQRFARSRGLGPQKHVLTRVLWLQDKVSRRELRIAMVKTEDSQLVKGSRDVASEEECGKTHYNLDTNHHDHVQQDIPSRTHTQLRRVDHASKFFSRVQKRAQSHTPVPHVLTRERGAGVEITESLPSACTYRRRD